MVANEQVLQRRSSGKLRNHWSPDSSDVEDAKGFKTINFDERDVVNKKLWWKYWRTNQFCGVAEDKDKPDWEEQGRHHLVDSLIQFFCVNF